MDDRKPLIPVHSFCPSISFATVSIQGLEALICQLMTCPMVGLNDSEAAYALDRLRLRMRATMRTAAAIYGSLRLGLVIPIDPAVGSLTSTIRCRPVGGTPSPFSAKVSRNKDLHAKYSIQKDYGKAA